MSVAAAAQLNYREVGKETKEPGKNKESIRG